MTTADLHDEGRSATRSLVIATWALFVALAFLICGVGLFGTVIGIRSQQNGFSVLSIGVIGAAYYGGFLIGSKLTLALLANVGHIRVFAALAAMLSADTLLAGLIDDVPGWVVIRLLSGVFTAGLYVVAESWLNGVATNLNRGRLLAIYLVVTGAAYGLGQVLVGTLPADAMTGFALCSMLVAVSVAPVALSESAEAPTVATTERIGLRELAEVVPTGVGAGLLVGLTHGAFVALAVVYATQAGLSPGAAGLFAAISGVGGVVLQWPLSAASDEMDRRFVGAFTALAATGASVWLLAVGPRGTHGLVVMFVLGGLSLPLYSVGSAYTSDFVEPQQIGAASSQMVLLYGIGALVGPIAGSAMMHQLGPRGYPWSMIVMHLLVAVFFVYRMFASRSPIAKTSWADASISTRAFFVPANVVWMSRRLHRRVRDR